MFNLSGSELIFLLLMALVILGPEKLPEAIRKFTKTYSEIKKMSTGFQSELRSALDEPMKEMRETADALRRSVDVDGLTEAIKNAGNSPAPAEPPAPAPAEPPLPAPEPAAKPETDTSE